jgi:hypothetical protein
MQSPEKLPAGRLVWSMPTTCLSPNETTSRAVGLLYANHMQSHKPTTNRAVGLVYANHMQSPNETTSKAV